MYISNPIESKYEKAENYSLSGEIVIILHRMKYLISWFNYLYVFRNRILPKKSTSQYKMKWKSMLNLSNVTKSCEIGTKIIL